MMDEKKHLLIHPNMDGYKVVTDQIGYWLTLGEKVTVDLFKGEREKRSLNANALYAVWVTEIAKWGGDLTKNIRGEHKRDFGVDIVLAGEDEYAEVLEYVLRKTNYQHMTFEQKAIFLQVIAITSQMKTKQHSFFRKQLQIHYAEQGLILEVK